jgi:hypothetical protein
MKNKSLAILTIIILTSSLFIISLIKAEDTNTPPGTPNIKVPGEEINPATGLPRNIEAIQNIGDNLTNEDIRTAYLKAEWQKILEKSETFGPTIRFIEKLDPASNILLGMPIAFSWFFFLTLVIWIAFIILIFRITALFEISKKWLHYVVALALIAAITYFKYPLAISKPIISIIALLNQWWMQYVVIGIVILVIIILTYFSKQLKVIYKAIKEKNKKNMEELQQTKMKKDLAVMDELRKAIES